jgi:hypothetical protein
MKNAELTANIVYRSGSEAYSKKVRFNPYVSNSLLVSHAHDVVTWRSHTYTSLSKYVCYEPIIRTFFEVLTRA